MSAKMTKTIEYEVFKVAPKHFLIELWLQRRPDHSTCFQCGVAFQILAGTHTHVCTAVTSLGNQPVCESCCQAMIGAGAEVIPGYGV